jgi:hypothetical protein
MWIVVIQGKRQKAGGKSEEVLGDFTFLYIPLNFYVHLLNSSKLSGNVPLITILVNTS